MDGHFKHRLHPKKPPKAPTIASNPNSPPEPRPGSTPAKPDVGSPAATSCTAPAPSLSGTGTAAADGTTAAAAGSAPTFKGLKWKLLHVYQDEQKAKEEREAEEKRKQEEAAAAAAERAAKEAELAAAEQARKDAEAEAARIAAEAEAARRQEAEAREAEAREAKEKEARAREAREQEAKEKEAKEREAKEREAKEEAARIKEKEDKERKAREADDARKRKAAAAAALQRSSDLDLMDDMFVTLPSMPPAPPEAKHEPKHAAKQEGKQDGKQEEGEGSKPLKKVASKAAVGSNGQRMAGGDEAGGKSHKADKHSKRAREPDSSAHDPVGDGASALKKPREGSEPLPSAKPLQAHHSLSGSTDKGDGPRPGEARTTGETGTKPASKKPRTAETVETESSPPGRLPSKPSKQQGSGGKDAAAEAGGGSDRKGSGGGATAVAAAAAVPVSPRLGPNIVAVKPGDNGAQDPAARKPAVVQLASSGSPLPIIGSPAAAQSKNGPAGAVVKTAGGQAGGSVKKEGPVKKEDGAAGGVKGEKSGEKKAGMVAAGKQGTSAAGATLAGKGKDKQGAAGGSAPAKGAVEARQGEARQGEAGASGAKQAGGGSTQATGHTESGTHPPQERFVDCILECGCPGLKPAAPGLPPWTSLPSDLTRTSHMDAAGGSQPVLRAKVDLAKVRSMRELWAQLSLAFNSDVLPDRLRAQLIYMDGDGDWLLFAPDEPWGVIAGNARKLLISPTS